MKKLLILLFSILCLTSYGQTNILDIGAEGGCSLASIRGIDKKIVHHKSRVGYCGGLFVQYNFRKILSIRTGAYYERKGSSFEVEATDEIGTTIGIIHGNENFDYINVPLLIRATFGKKLKFFVNAGPYVGFLLKQSEHVKALNDFPGYNNDNTHSFKKTETGISAGVGISYSCGNRISISLEIRDNLGLSNTSAVEVYNNGTIKTNALTFLPGINYKLGQRKTAE